MSDNDVNIIQQIVEELQDQNAIDFQQWKKLGKDIEKLSEKIKISDTNLSVLMKKIKNDYEKLRKVIIDENVQFELKNKIEDNKNEINKKVNIKTFEDKIEEHENEINKKVNNETFQNTIVEFNSQLINKASKNETQNIQQQVNNLVLGAVGDGNNPEIIQARGDYSLLTDRLNFGDKINNILFMKNLRKNISEGRTEKEFYYEYPIKKGVEYSIKTNFKCNSSAYYSIVLCKTSTYNNSTDFVIYNKVLNSSSNTINVSKDYNYIYVFVPNLSASLNFEISNNSLEEDILYLKNKLNENIANNEWFGKKAIFMGDSITAGMNTDKIYHEYLKDDVGFSECINYGQNGSTIAKNFRGMVERYNTMSDGDIVFVFGGTNDFGSNTAMGNFYSVSEDGTKTLSTDITTFKGALNVIIEGLQKKYNGKQIIFLTPIHRNYIANQFNDLQKNSVGYYLDDYVMSIKEACSIHSVEYIDLFTCSGLNPRVSENATLYFHKGSDELHPNANGHKKIANIIQARLRNIKPNN